MFDLELSDFAVECILYANERSSPTLPIPLTLDGFPRPSAAPTIVPLGSDNTIVSAHAVSVSEKTWYYSGITDDDDQPELLYRTGSDKYPWVEPTGRHAHPPTKSPRGVYGTPLHGVWDTVGPQVCDLVHAAVKTRYSIDPVRFATAAHGEEGTTLGPVVIWVTVYPKSTSADTAYEVSKDILRLLDENGVKDVEVEWCEAVLWRAAAPPLLPVVSGRDATAHVRRNLTAVLGMPIAAAEMEIDDSQGSVGFFFHENLDKNGSPSNKVFAVTNHHVLCTKDEKTYDFRAHGSPRRRVRVNGLRRFQKGLDEIKVAIGDRGSDAELHTRQIADIEDAEGENAEELHLARGDLDEAKKAIVELEKFYKEVIADWGDIERRNIGHLHYSPPISVDVEGTRYTEDWGTILLDEGRFKPHFKGNVVDLGTEFHSSKLTKMMYPRGGGRTTFEYLVNRQLRIRGILTMEQLANPESLDSEGEPCLVVLKDGSATDLTVGRHAGLESFQCDENGVRSMELAIYNYGKPSRPFSEKGDSGSLIFDGQGSMVGLLHSGKSKTRTASAYVTYATPAWWLVDRIKEIYPHADFFRTAY